MEPARALDWRGASALLLLVLAVHLPLHRNGYTQDDHIIVVDNPVVARASLSEILSSSYWAPAQGDDRSLFRPLTILSFALERRLVGRSDPVWSHAINVVLHGLATLALLLFAHRLRAGRAAAWIAAAVFAVHAAHVEAIAAAVGRAELLAALFCLIALSLSTAAGPWFAEGFAPTRSSAAAWGAGLATFLALTAKEIGVATPLLLGLLELQLRRAVPVDRVARWHARARRLAPCALAVAAYLLLRWRALGVWIPRPHVPLHDNPLGALDGPELWATTLAVAAQALEVLVLPLALSADWSGRSIGIETGLLAVRPLLGLALLGGALALVLAGVRAAGRPASDRPPPVALLGFAASMFLVPYAIIGNLFFHTGTIFAERLLYLPSTGFCLFLGLLLARLPPLRLPALGWRPRLGTLLAAVLVVFLSGLTWRRCTVWRDDVTLFREAARVNPASPRAQYVLSLFALERGDREQARAHAQRAIELWPDHAPARMTLGVLLAVDGRLAEAAAQLEEAVRLDPRLTEAHFNLALALRGLGRPADAEQALRHALALSPDQPDFLVALGNVLGDQRRHAEAAAAYGRALALGRDVGERLRDAEQAAREEPR